jgi:branched-chain amino acid transport system permease protein
VVSSEQSSGGVRVASDDGEEVADPGSATPAETPPRAPAGPDGPDEGTRTGGGSAVDRLPALVLEHRTRVIWGLAAFLVLGGLAASEVDLGGVLVFGTSTGSVYALVALGIVLVYRSTKVLNFAQGEFGTMPAFLVLMLLLGFDRAATVDASAVSTLQLASYALVGVAFGAILAIGVNALIVQRLAEANPVTSLVATAGVSLLMIGFQIVTFELQNRTFPRFFPGSVCVIPGPDGCVLPTNRHNIVILIVLVVVGAAFAALFRTELGTALLAVAQDPFAASLHGVSPRAMSMLAWGLAGALGALGGILGAGFFEGLTPGLMTTTFLLPAFTAVILGGITSMPGAVVGGLLVGLTAALANGVVTGYGLSNVPNPPTLASFALLLVVLLVKPSGLFGKGA